MTIFVVALGRLVAQGPNLSTLNQLRPRTHSVGILPLVQPAPLSAEISPLPQIECAPPAEMVHIRMLDHMCKVRVLVTLMSVHQKTSSSRVVRRSPIEYANLGRCAHSIPSPQHFQRQLLTSYAMFALRIAPQIHL